MSTGYPHLTTAVIVEQDDRILMVHEEDNGIKCWNQPAGHVELGESLVEGAVRETLEETRYEVELTGLVGIYQSKSPRNGLHYVRVCFTARTVKLVENAPLDADIEEVRWLPLDAVLAGDYTLRHPSVHQCLSDYRAGHRFPLDLIKPFTASMEPATR